MMKGRKYIVLIILILLSVGLRAQQQPHFTQYMFNEFVINPAMAGVQDHFQIRTSHRFQWVGVLDPPMTNTISCYGPHKKLDMGYGVSIYNDVTGPTSRSGINASYAYQLELAADLKLSLGLSLGILQYRIDGTQLDPADASDPALLGLISTSYVPDGGIGAYLYSKQYYVGLSFNQLFNSNIKVWDSGDGVNRLKTNINMVGGYRFYLEDDFIIEPSVMLRFSFPSYFAFDVSTIVKWRNEIWGGLSYRFHEAFAIMLGYSFDETLSFGYAYDFGLGDIQNYHVGSHELMIGYRFGKMK